MVWLNPTDYKKQEYMELRFDVCFDNWIKKDYWIKIIHNIEVDLINFSKEENEFLNTFIAWITDALQHTSVIVVEGNL